MKTKYLLFLILSLLIPFLFYQQITTASESPVIGASQISKICQNTKRPDLCLVDQFSTITKTNSLETTLKVLSELQKTDSKNIGCHFIAHVIAFEEIKKNPTSFENFLSKFNSDDCTGGFIMGAVEAFKYLNKETTLNEQLILKLCHQTNSESSNQSCIHSMGHLLLVENSGNIDQAVKVCETLPSKYHYECQSGIFMENLFRRNLQVHQILEPFEWTQDSFTEQQKLCDKYSGVTTQACWRELSHLIVSLSKGDPGKVYQGCLNSKTLVLQKACFTHGIEVMVLSTKFDPEKSRSFCQPLVNNKIDYQLCLSDIANTLPSPAQKEKASLSEFFTGM